MNDKEITLLLLQIIRVNGNTMYLLEQGYTLYALTQEIETLKKKGLVCSKEQELTLTKRGDEYFYELNRKLGRRGLYKYISRHLILKDEPMPLNAVYVPPKRDKGKKKQIVLVECKKHGDVSHSPSE